MALLLASGACTPTSGEADCLEIGLAAAYTGVSAANGANFERTMQVALDQINDSGGAADQKLCLVGADTHSRAEAGARAVTSLVVSDGVDLLVGPESLEATARVEDVLQDHNVFHVVPGVTAQSLNGDQRLKLELGPVAEHVGCAMAKHAYDDNHRKLIVVYTEDAANAAAAESIPASLADHQRSTSPAEVELFPIPEGDSPPSVGLEITKQSPDAVLILTPVTVASLILQDWAVLSERPAWYLGPNVLCEALVRNTPAGVLEGAKGIGPSFLNKSDAEALDARLDDLYGDHPFPVGYYYYDAAALLGLAIEAAYQATGSPPSTTDIAAAMRSVSTSPGTELGWDELGRGIRLLRKGEAIDYRGVSGPLTMDHRGRLQYSGEFNFDVVRDGSIEFEGREICIQ